MPRIIINVIPYEMNSATKQYQLVINYMQLLGIGIFLALYYLSTKKYPGGSQVNIENIGFDWINNYWCNLISKVAMNGEPNPARPYAILAMSIICLSLCLFFYQFAKFISLDHKHKIVIKYGGILCMITGLFLFTDYHGLVTTISSIFGLAALIGIYLEIRIRKQDQCKLLGTLLIGLLLINNIIYYSGQFISSLPIVQKATFILTFIWVLNYNQEIRNIIRKKYNGGRSFKN